MYEAADTQLETIRAAVGAVVDRTNRYAGLIRTEADAQAELHAELLNRIAEPASIIAGDGLLTHAHHHWPMVGSRVYREISATFSRATPRADITILRASAKLEPKASGAPARFQGPVAALIELKLDLGRSRGAAISAQISRDFDKWEAEVETGAADQAVAVVFTDRPEDYAEVDPQKVVVAPVARSRPVDHHVDSTEASEAMTAALHNVVAQHKSQPMSMLREKDFETRIARFLRDYLGDRASAVRTQARTRCSRTGRLRPVDVAIFNAGTASISSALEIKTSHSLTFKTIGRSQLEDEADFLTGLVEDGLCAEARVAVFRYGAKPKCDDVESWAVRRSRLPLTYSEC